MRAQTGQSKEATTGRRQTIIPANRWVMVGVAVTIRVKLRVGAGVRVGVRFGVGIDVGVRVRKKATHDAVAD